ncbi:MAG: hypothetical protein QXD19_00210 [Candidatus Bathyarchaeia archaeon]
MKLKKWFETDLGYEATKEKLLKSRNIIGDGQDFCGRLSFKFVDLKDYTIQITTKGKLGIFYPEISNPDIALEKLKPYMVTAEGLPAKIIKEVPLKNSTSPQPNDQLRKMSITLQHPFNVDQSGKGFFAWLEKRAERKRLEENKDEIARLAPIAERYNLDFLKKYVEIRKEQLKSLNE